MPARIGGSKAAAAGVAGCWAGRDATLHQAATTVSRIVRPNSTVILRAGRRIAVSLEVGKGQMMKIVDVRAAGGRVS